MDLFHTITQEIENVLSCHWLSEFRDTHRKNGSQSNSASTSTTPSANASRSGSVAPSPLRRSSSTSSASSISSTPASPILSALESNTKQKMSDQFMDTEPGGESTQYESIKTVTKPTSKEEGQLGDASTGTKSASEGEKTGVDPERAEKTAENIRYGQNISESGVGGFTGTTEGSSANQEGGYGGTKAQEELEGNVSGNSGGRTEQGYSAKDGTHDYNVGG